MPGDMLVVGKIVACSERNRWQRLALLLFTALGILAACQNDSSPEDYYRRLAAINRDIAEEGQRLASDISHLRTAASVQQAADIWHSALVDAEATYRTAVEDLEELRPPATAAQTHQRLLSLARRIRDLFARIVRTEPLSIDASGRAISEGLSTLGPELNRVCIDLEETARQEGVSVDLDC